jgi:hypothetical protein
VTDDVGPQHQAVVIVPKDEYDRLVAAAIDAPVMETIKRFRAADAVWSVQTIERRATVGEWDEITIIGTRPFRDFKNYAGPDWEANAT